MKKSMYLAILSLLIAVNAFIFVRCALPQEDPTIIAAEEDTSNLVNMLPRYPVNYISLGVPTNVNTTFKTYMDWRTITSTTSNQYKLIQQYGWCDENGFMRVNGERDLEITDDYYIIALGSYYGTDIGTKYRITTDEGNIFYGILGDCKADIHTNSTHQYSFNNDVVEFIVDTRYLNSSVKRLGSGNAMPNLSGNIIKIERMKFNGK